MSSNNDAWNKYLTPRPDGGTPAQQQTPPTDTSREVIEGYEADLRTEKDRRLTAETALAWAMKHIQELEKQLGITEPPHHPRREMALEILPEMRQPHDPDGWKQYLASPPQDD